MCGGESFFELHFVPPKSSIPAKPAQSECNRSTDLQGHISFRTSIQLEEIKASSGIFAHFAPILDQFDVIETYSYWLINK